MKDFFKQLNENQIQAVLYNEGPSLIIAGAGSGKTRVLTYKISYLLKNYISPCRILALTFTNKSAREMRLRISKMVGENITHSLLYMGTFHSLFSKILRREAMNIGFHSNFTIYDSQDSKNLIKTIIKEKKLDTRIYRFASIQTFISKAKNTLITPEKYAANYNWVERDIQNGMAYLQKIYSIYQNRCKIANAMDFDDLLLYTYLLFIQYPKVIQKYRNKFQYILVDEYQDTNLVQHEIVKQLSLDHQRVCVVGDDAQSIYSFRGANIENILNFRQNYPKCKIFKLEQNYRSTQTIVNAANSLICKNQRQIPKNIYSKKNIGNKIKVISTYSDYEEGYKVANLLSEMQMLYNYNYRDFVILYRTNVQSRIFEEALRKLNIPYKVCGGLSFYQRKEIKNIIAYMRLVSNLDDEEALKRIINYPIRGIGDMTIKKMTMAANLYNTTLWKILLHPSNFNLKFNISTKKKLNKFLSLILFFRKNIFSKNAYDIGQIIIKELGLIQELYKNSILENISCIQNIKELLNSLHFFVTSRMKEKKSNIAIHDFLEEISLLTDQDISKEETNQVTMMTVHASKGLEFKNVFIVGMQENLFPSELSKHVQKMEEERRLFYVAITRAEENVIITYSKNNRTISQFINDIDKQYLYFYLEPYSYYSNKKKSIKEKKSCIDYFNQLKIGDTIRHEQFGKGQIIELSDNNEKAIVKFNQLGSKRLFLKFARFEKVN